MVALADDVARRSISTNSLLEKHEIKTNVVLLEGQRTDLTLVVDLVSSARGIPCHLSRRPVFGDHDWIIFLAFKDGIEWVARIPLRHHENHPQLTFDSPEFKDKYECMISTLEYVVSHTTLPVPRIQRYDLTCENVLRRPYILMDCLPGKPLETVIHDWTKEDLESVVKQWAEYTMEMARLKFPAIGTLHKGEGERWAVGPLLSTDIMQPGSNKTKAKRGPFRSVADYILAMSNLKKSTMATTNSDSHAYGNFLRSSLLESLIPFFVLPEYLNAPFVLSHRTFDVQNILVDSSGRLSGILSWHNAAILPLQSHIRVPDSLNFEFMPLVEREANPSLHNFSKRYRPIFEKAMIEMGSSMEWNTEELIDRSLMFGLFEKAILSAENERFLPALWEHVFGNGAGAEEFRGAMKKGDWGIAMADRWGIEVGNTPSGSR